MNEPQVILEYLPSSYKIRSENEYINFLWEAFETNYQNKKYQFAMLAYHMLYMSFVYFSVWQIKLNRNDDFAKSLVGFSKDDEKNLLEATSPFSFWVINENRIFRFLKLIGCENQHIGQFAKLVEMRNNIAHSNGNIFFNDQADANVRIEETLEQIEAVQQRMNTVIHNCLQSFLVENTDSAKWQYSDVLDQIREVLINPNYFSPKDIEACLSFDINTLSTHANFEAIKSLFENFKKLYSDGAE